MAHRKLRLLSAYSRIVANDHALRGKFYAALTIVGLFIVLGSLLLPKKDSVFRIDSITFSTTIIPTADQPAWPVGKGGMTILPIPTGCDAESFRPSPGSKIELLSHENSEIEITVAGDNGAGEFNCGGGQMRSSASDVSIVGLAKRAKEAPVFIRFVGKATFGRDIDIGDIQPPTLVSGKIIVESNSVPFPTAKIETEHDLQLGDRVQFLKSPAQSGDGLKSEQAVSSGLIVLDDNNSYRVLARASAKEASVIRFGRADGEAVAYAPTFLTRFQASAEYVIWIPLAWLILKLAEGLLLMFKRPTPETRAQQRAASRLKRLLLRKACPAVVLLGLGSLCLYPDKAYAADAPVPARIMLDNVTGQALIFRAGGNCRALTAFHVVRDAEAVRLSTQSGQLVMAERREQAGDIALLDLLPGSDLDCAPLPAVDAVQASLNHNDYQLRQVHPVGLSRIALSISSETESTLIFSAINPADRPRLEKGISGSPIFAGARPIAIATSIDATSGEVLAYRIDALQRLFPKLSATPQESGAPASVSPRQVTPLLSQPARLRQPGNINAVYSGSTISFFDITKHQAISNATGMIFIKDSKISVGRMDFELDDAYLLNQPEATRAVVGVKFHLCAKLDNTTIPSRSEILCFQNFSYLPRTKYATGVRFLEFPESICTRASIEAYQCRLWLYYVQSGQSEGSGGAHYVRELIELGKVNPK